MQISDYISLIKVYRRNVISEYYSCSAYISNFLLHSNHETTKYFCTNVSIVTGSYVKHTYAIDFKVYAGILFVRNYSNLNMNMNENYEFNINDPVEKIAHDLRKCFTRFNLIPLR